MFSTQYSLAQSFANIGSGRNDRFIYSDIANKFSDLSEQVGYLSVKARGAKGNGNNVSNRNDDSSAILDAITEASLSGRGIEFPAGVYYITKSIDIYDCKFYKGAILLPSSNLVTIRFNGHIDAGLYKIFDRSLSGKFDLSKAYLKHIEARWYGLIGDGTTDDIPNLDFLTANVPDFKVVEFDQFLQMAIFSTWVVNKKTQVSFRTKNIFPFDAYYGQQIGSFIWKGSAGGRVINLQNTGTCEVKGFFIDAQNAGVGIDIDQDLPADPARISTANRVINNNILGGPLNRSFIAIRIAFVSPSNVEYCYIEENRFSGNGYIGLCKYYNGGVFGANGACTVSCTVGNPNITFGTGILANYIASGISSIRIRINGLGTGSKGTLLDTTLTILTSTTGTLAVNPNATLVAGTPYFILDENCGTGIQVWHQNSKRHMSVRNHYNALKIGCDIQGGSFQSTADNFPDCDVNLFYANSNTLSEPCWDRSSNSENSRQHLVYFGGQPYSCEHARLAPSPCPGAGIIVMSTGGAELKIKQLETDSSLQYALTGASVFDFSQAGGATVTMEGVVYPSSCTIQDIGIDNSILPNQCLIRAEGQTQSGGAAIQNSTQEYYNYDPSVGKHDVRYNKCRTSLIQLFPDLTRDISDLPNLQARLDLYSGAMWIDYSGPTSIFRIEERTPTNTLNTRYLYNTLRNSTTYDPPNLASLTSTSTTITVTGAAIGDKVRVGFSLDLQLIMLSGYVSSANTVTVVFFNPTAGAINLASGTLSATVEKS